MTVAAIVSYLCPGKDVQRYDRSHSTKQKYGFHGLSETHLQLLGFIALLALKSMFQLFAKKWIKSSHIYPHYFFFGGEKYIYKKYVLYAKRGIYSAKAVNS